MYDGNYERIAEFSSVENAADIDKQNLSREIWETSWLVWIQEEKRGKEMGTINPELFYY